MSEYLYLDIETVGTSDPEVVAEITASITPSKSMSKAETIADWEANTKPGLVRDAVAKSALNGATGKVICVGWAWNDEEVESQIGPDEGRLLSQVARYLDEQRGGFDHGFNTPIIVGHNVTGFDIRYLWQRAFVLGVKMPAWFPRDPKPWSDKVHDTMVIWGGARDYISLDSLCRALRLPGKSNITGADVGGMWERGEADAIAEYCRSDVERVRAIHRKMLLAFGEAA